MTEDYEHYFTDTAEWLQFQDVAARITFADGYVDPPPQTWAFDHALLQRLEVVDFLALFPQTGRIRAQRLADQARVSPKRRMSALTDRQRSDLIASLDAYLPT